MRYLLLLTLMIGTVGCVSDSDGEADQAKRDANMFDRQANQEKQDFEEP